MNIEFLETLSKVEQILYASAYNFAIKYSKATEEEAHKEGVKEVDSLKGIEDEVIDYVDISTGEKFSCTESEMMARNA